MKTFSIILTFFFTSTTWAQDGDGAQQRKLLRTGQLVLEEIQNSPDQKISARLIAKAKAIIVFPTMVKAGFFVGARYGKGFASVRTRNLVNGALRLFFIPPAAVSAFNLVQKRWT